MKQKLIKLAKFFSIATLLSIQGCNFDDLPATQTYKEAPLENIKLLQIIPGENQVAVSGVIEDSDVTQLKITWENESELIIDVNATTQADTIETVITGLDEKTYMFKVVTYDANGNSSKPITGGSEVYGANYFMNLANREVVSSNLEGNFLTVSFKDIASGGSNLGTELIYESTEDIQKEIFIPPSSSNFSVSDFKRGTTFKFRSAFVFSPVNIDTTFTQYNMHKPLVIPELVNSVSPFTVEESDGSRWGTLAAPWVTNEAAKNHNGYGGHDSKSGSFFNIESGWTAPGVVNGKIYQTLTLDPATYQVILTINDTNYSINHEGGAYIMIANGIGIPDVEEIDNAEEVINYQRIDGPNVYTVEFTIEETQEISFGLLSSQDDSGIYGKITSWELTGAR